MVKKNLRTTGILVPGNKSSLSVLKVVENIQKYWNEVQYKIKNNPKKFHETKLLSLDSSKANKYLKWKNVWDNSKTIKKTTDWYRDYYTKSLVKSEQDLRDYIEDAKKKSLEWTKQ